jgi:hypothetical protein
MYPPDEQPLATLMRRVADSMGRSLSCLDKSKRRSAWKAPVFPIPAILDAMDGLGEASIFNRDEDPRVAYGIPSLTVASPVQFRVMLLGGTGVGLTVGVAVGSRVGESVSTM